VNGREVNLRPMDPKKVIQIKREEKIKEGEKVPAAKLLFPEILILVLSKMKCRPSAGRAAKMMMLAA
jgi:hypothetical protein